VIVEARAPPARALGLAGLRRMPSHVGLLLPRCRSVHTIAMRFALDLAWLDEAGEVVRVDHEVRPSRVRSCRAARSVLETRAGAMPAFLDVGGAAIRG
jgi:uncharacterized membrane protein (UPF0127 family)